MLQWGRDDNIRGLIVRIDIRLIAGQRQVVVQPVNAVIVSAQGFYDFQLDFTLLVGLQRRLHAAVPCGYNRNNDVSEPFAFLFAHNAPDCLYDIYDRLAGFVKHYPVQRRYVNAF